MSLFILSPADTRLLNICLQAVGCSYQAQLGSFPWPVFLPEHPGSEDNPCYADEDFPSITGCWAAPTPQQQHHRPEQGLEPWLSSPPCLSKRCYLCHGLKSGVIISYPRARSALLSVGAPQGGERARTVPQSPTSAASMCGSWWFLLT